MCASSGWRRQSYTIHARTLTDFVPFSGSGAFGAVQKLRELGFKGSITMISNEGYLPIDRTKLSKALIADSSKVALRTEDFYSSADIAFIQDTATAVDFDKKSVATKSGSNYPYTNLILATGGTPKNLPLPGFKDLSNIFVLRQVQNVQDIMKAVGDKGKKIVIVGSSFIGMEVANALAKDNTVSIIGMEEAPLERIMGKVVGRIFQKNLEKNGAKFYMGASVDSAIPSSKDKNAVGAVKLKDGTELEADLVILGIGVGPATEFLKGNDSVKLEKDGSIQTDEFFKVKGMEGVYALGDIATYPYHGPGGDGAMTRIEHWSKSAFRLPNLYSFLWNCEANTSSSDVAQNSGRTVAQLIAQPSTRPKPFIPIFWSALGGQLRYCGNTPSGWDDLILQGKPEESKFAAYYTKGDVVVAAATMMMDPVMAKCAELMRRGNMPSKKDIQGGVDVLTVDLPGKVAI
jgi:NADH dehydrogenase FAD-containing subunit